MSEKKYIDADLLKGELKALHEQEWLEYVGTYDCINSIPAANVAEIVHGKWICNTDDFTPKYRCSVCGYNKPIVAGENITQEPKNYCPHCGAKMDKKSEG